MVRSIGALCSAVAILAACGGSASTDSGESPSTTVAATLASGDVVAIATPACDLLTADEVAAATGFAVAAVNEEPPITCVFDLAASVDVFLTVDDGQGRMIGPAAVFEAYSDLIAAGNAEEVGGVGQAAVYAPGFRGLAVDAGGGRFIGLGINGGYQELSDPRDALVLLAKAALSRL